MNRHYLRPSDYGHNYDPPTTEPHQRFAVSVLFALALIATAAFAFQAFATPPDATFTLSTKAAESPASTVLTWTCKGAAATALSTPNQAGWSGAIALTGTRKMTNIRMPSLYGIKCDGAPGTSGFTVKWTMDQLVNFDGSALTDLLAWDVSYGATADTRTTHVRVPNPLARETFIAAPPGDYFVAVQGVVSRTLLGKATEMLGHESNVVPKTATATAAESTTISDTVEVYALPVAPVAQ